jgi:hypothetical protein
MVGLVSLMTNAAGIPGPAGPKGDTGDPGPAGADGAAGPAGLTFRGDWSAATSYVSGDTVVSASLTYFAKSAVGPSATAPASDATHWAPLAIQGSQGPQGPQGTTGLTGNVGADGPIGPEGPQGPAGVDGAAGAAGADGAQGPQGEQGIQGAIGPSVLNWRGIWDSGTTYAVNDWIVPAAGSQSYFALRSNTNKTPASNPLDWAILVISGPQGIQGVAGATGAAGATGLTGATGPTGAQGVIGPAGPSGGGALSARLNAAITNVATSLVLVVDGEWPVIGTDCSSYYILIDNEVMKVTADSISNGLATLTVTRAQRSTVAAAHNKNATAYMRLVTALIGGAIPQNLFSAATAPTLAQGNQHFFHPSTDSTARTFTIPANASVAFPIGTTLTIINDNGAGVVTIAITSDTMRLAGAGTTGSRSLAANGMATAVKVAATKWVINGSGLT